MACSCVWALVTGLSQPAQLRALAKPCWQRSLTLWASWWLLPAELTGAQPLPAWALSWRLLYLFNLFSTFSLNFHSGQG